MNQPRHKGRFEKKSKTEWREKLSIAAKRRKIIHEESTYTITGCRTFDVPLLMEELWCKICDIPLAIQNIEKETKAGLASIFLIRCRQCLALHQVRTSKFSNKNPEDARKRKYAINIKTAAAVIDAGMGGSQLNTVLSECDMPTVHSSTLRRHEVIVEKALEELADESCQRAITEEKRLTLAEIPSQLSEEKENLPVQLTVSNDGAWSKRGNGFNYDSLSGLVSSFGVKSGKCLGRGTRTKVCWMCQRGHTKNDHKCHLNWEGSAKSMEPDITVQILTKNPQFEKENVVVGTLIGDDDSSTIAAVRRECSYPIQKWSDVNHTTKKLSKELWAHKIDRQVIEYLKNCFTYSLKQNKNDVKAVEKAIKNIVPHAFDEHNDCGIWCKYKDDPEGYKHNGLPGGKGLRGESLKSTLTKIFEPFWRNAKNLAPCGSSQVNESFNALVTSKAPKSRFYGGSGSYNARVNAAVLQKNEGTKYVLDLNKKCGVSTGETTEKYRYKKDCQRKIRANFCQEPEFKKRRKELKKSRSKKKIVAERKEGCTYSSDCGLQRNSEFIDKPTLNENVPADICFVIFDLETTGYSHLLCEISQIACKYNNQEFNSYIIPLNGIPRKITELTGLSVMDGLMFDHGNLVNGESLDDALKRFLNFLRNIGNNIVLVAHNCFRFDARFFIHSIQKTGLFEEFSTLVWGFADTYPALKMKMPERQKNKEKFNQRILTCDILGEASTVGAHNALNDVRTLERILNKVAITNDDLKNQVLSLSKVTQNLQNIRFRKDNIATFDGLLPYISKTIITKILNAGITFDVIKNTYIQFKDAGINNLFREDVNGHPRVTNNKSIISCAIVGIKKLLENKS